MIFIWNVVTLIVVRGCVVSILLHTLGLVIHNHLGQQKNSFLTAYSYQTKCWEPHKLWHIDLSSLFEFWSSTNYSWWSVYFDYGSKACGTLLLRISLNCAADVYLALLPIVFFALNAGLVFRINVGFFKKVFNFMCLKFSFIYLSLPMQTT